MKRVFRAIRNFFIPPADAKTFARILPLAAVAFLVILFFAFATYAWEESNAPSFCGLTCHTMPPEYVTYQHSAHTNVSCEDCHMGRDRLPVMIGRKVRYSWQTGTAMLFNTYEYPIFAKNMAPACEACENCHKPETFSNDKLVELKHYAEDDSNTLTTTYLAIKTGGGTSRQGLGYGIHWHIENPVYYYAADKEQQVIPYVYVENSDGSKVEYVDTEENFDPSTISADQMKKMDCITCHNRTAHKIPDPSSAMDELLGRGLVSDKIPEIKKKGVELLSAVYESDQAATDAIAGLTAYYQGQKPDFYNSNKALVENAVKAIQEIYSRTHFIDQKNFWDTHPDNLQHQDSPGCFRCHDGKHVAQIAGAAPATVRLECNLCHSVPVVSSASQPAANLALNKNFEPETHKNPNWINLHRTMFDQSCAGCHSTDDPGGTSNTSFCSNSVCHGTEWKFAGFNAPKMRAIVEAEAKTLITPTPEPSPTPEDDGGTTLEIQPTATATSAAPIGPLTYDANIEPLLTGKCGACHGKSGAKGLNVTTYADLLKGSASGPVIVPGDPDKSIMVQVQSGASPHFGQLSTDELKQLVQWIKDGAKEK